MTPRPRRRMLADLTPIIDIIMILLFGVMIHSVRQTEDAKDEAMATVQEAVQRSEADREQFLEKSDQTRELEDRIQQLRQWAADAEQRLAMSDAEREALERRLQSERQRTAQSVARLLQMTDAEKLTFEEKLVALSGAGAQKLENEIAELQADQDPTNILRAVRKIEEMQKVFTFVDLHITDRNLMTVTADNRELARISLIGLDAISMEMRIRKAIEQVNFSDLVLITFSADPSALNREVRIAWDRAIPSLVAYYRGSFEKTSFRVAEVGLSVLSPSGLSGD